MKNVLLGLIAFWKKQQTNYLHTYKEMTLKISYMEPLKTLRSLASERRKRTNRKSNDQMATRTFSKNISGNNFRTTRGKIFCQS